MQRLLYVSDSRIEAADVQSAVLQIVVNAQVKNIELGITGALIFTGEHFAQVLEGPQEAIDTLMAYINADPRHGNLVVVDRSSITRRRFPDWQMAYQGPSPFVSRHVARLMHATSQSEQRRAAADWVIELAREFAVPRKLPDYWKLARTRPSS